MKNKLQPVIPGPITKEDVPKIKNIIEILEKDKKAENFLEPVDPEGKSYNNLALNLPDYFDIIKQPMDISKIKVNIE